MDTCETNALERIARVLAGLKLSINGDGAGASVGLQVDQDWGQRLDAARAVLNTLREPDERMAAAGDAETWTRMVRAALGEDVAPHSSESKTGESKTWAGDTHQKPLG